ncbi:hypothetical protein [Aminobacter aminovorans]|uniref:DUF4234 domain-containing protein n=1 Tax=Aminobacter aminovorans TaxID=83263 RepID=A0ABR6H6N3_AMIAI|nr:hypothetical protein [Aminobacter aminovorans]MBB3706180.1 hypothetical protein [Aminobacter aminovorans]
MLNTQFLKSFVQRLIIANILSIVIYYGLAISTITPGLSDKNAASIEFRPEYLLKMNIIFLHSGLFYFCWLTFHPEKTTETSKPRLRLQTYSA